MPPRSAPAASPVRPRRAPRRAGRPALKDAEHSRGAILDAAVEAFARAGLGGARVEDIATRAGVNVGLLYYYYGSKDALFVAVLERAYAMIREAERALELDTVEPEEGVRRLVEFSWNYYFSHPEFITLLNSENLHPGRHLEGSTRVAELHSPLLELIRRLLERGARKRVFRRGVDPMQLYITIASLGYFYLSNRHTLSAIFERDLMTPAARAARLAHMVEVVLGYLRPRAGEAT